MTVAVEVWDADAYGADKGKLVLPVYTLSPEEIFKNEIPLFDVNFFNPNTEKYSSAFSFLSEERTRDRVSVGNGKR